MKSNVLNSHGRGLTVLTPEDPFRFACRSRLDCYTRCCRDITVFLTPYDIIGVKKALGISSGEFLRSYTETLVSESGLPVVLLKMQDDGAKSCPFVTSRGCTIYGDRPWACRIYPLQPEYSKAAEKPGRDYYSVMDVPFCLGFGEDQVTTVAEWVNTQGVPVYQEMERIFRRITMSRNLQGKKIANRMIQEMVYMAAYDLDRFRSFVFDSTFLRRFEVDPAEIAGIRQDDVALYRFAVKWLEYGLTGKQAFEIRPEASVSEV